jgi:L-2-hydroxyglutarate oxidase LhgO
MENEKYDIAIIGGGIVGLATAMALGDSLPQIKLVILEKEKDLASHQTGHNSGVIHAGIYYKPGSYKATLCVEGSRLMTQFCEENGVPYDRCGKLIVATSDEELPRLQTLYERGTANGIQGLELIGPERAREIEPHAKAVRALYSPVTAITGYKMVADAMAAKIEQKGGRILKSTCVEQISRADGLFHLETNRSTVRAQNIINCAGLHADRIARLLRMKLRVALIPFRGEYYSLRPDCGLVRGLIYPVPDPEFPFLGVHFTKLITPEKGINSIMCRRKI